MSESLYTKYGGAAAVSAVVHDFYSRIQRDSELSRFFADVDMSQLIAHQTNFMGRALGGPDIFDGADLTTAHASRGIDDAAFNAVSGHLREALEAAGFEEGDAKEVIELIGSLRPQVVQSGPTPHRT